MGYQHYTFHVWRMRMILLMAGNASVLDLILQADRKPGNGEVGVLSSGPGSTGHWTPGGAAFTAALAAAQQGVGAAVFHPLPASADLANAQTVLRRAGIDLSRAPMMDIDAGRCVLVYTSDGRYAWSTANPEVDSVDFTALLDGVDHLAITSRWEEWTDAILTAAVSRGIPISLVGEPAAQARNYRWSNVILDEEQLAEVGQITADVIVETKGANGATLHEGSQTTDIPASPAEVVDTTGAGDTFGGVFVACRMKGADASSAARTAAEAAARTCEAWGAWAGVRGSTIAPLAEDAAKRVAGALAGTACGDAFGMPNSFLSTPPWRKKMMEGPAESPYHAGYPAGRITDDTEQALALTDALEDGFSIEAVARRLNDWFVSVGGENSLAVGPSTKRAMLAYQADVSVREIGRTGVTNGAAMRVSPIGVYAGLQNRSLEELVDVVETACLPTHHTGVAIAGAAAVAAAIAAAVQGKGWEDVMSAAVEAARIGATRGAWIYSASVADRIVHARRLAAGARSDQEFVHIISDIVGAGEPTTESVPAAIAIADYAGADPARAIEISGNLRGDTDTVAAMAGAICGAYAGIDALPSEWVELVSGVNKLDIASWSARLTNCASELAEARA
jgi:ADP-ribosylglycohydrolase/sugar/nucleoside kinase (ribokinase family)